MWRLHYYLARVPANLSKPDTLPGLVRRDLLGKGEFWYRMTPQLQSAL